jgi:hypothetical protein
VGALQKFVEGNMKNKDLQRGFYVSGASQLFGKPQAAIRSGSTFDLATILSKVRI